MGPLLIRWWTFEAKKSPDAVPCQPYELIKYHSWVKTGQQLSVTSAVLAFRR
jgi:hypothetical protein